MALRSLLNFRFGGRLLNCFSEPLHLLSRVMYGALGSVFGYECTPLCDVYWHLCIGAFLARSKLSFYFVCLLTMKQCHSEIWLIMRWPRKSWVVTECRSLQNIAPMKSIFSCWNVGVKNHLIDPLSHRWSHIDLRYYLTCSDHQRTQTDNEESQEWLWSIQIYANQ